MMEGLTEVHNALFKYFCVLGQEEHIVFSVQMNFATVQKNCEIHLSYCLLKFKLILFAKYIFMSMHKCVCGREGWKYSFGAN